MKGIRESLLHHLTVVLGDDELAANFMLLHLLSKVRIVTIVLIIYYVYTIIKLTIFLGAGSCKGRLDCCGKTIT